MKYLLWDHPYITSACFRPFLNPTTLSANVNISSYQYDIKFFENSPTYFFVHVGKGKSLFEFKGQLISKGLFSILNSSKKRTKNLTTMIPQDDLLSFVFWKNLKTPKSHFEINLPLAHHYFKVSFDTDHMHIVHALCRMFFCFMIFVAAVNLCPEI